MKSPYDLVIVGSGMFGAVCAYELKRKGFRCLVLEKRQHIGGNCYTETRDGINLHRYGAHIFHTSNPKIWSWINQFAVFNEYVHRVQAVTERGVFSVPINLNTLRQLWKVQTSEEAREKLNSLKIPTSSQDSLEDFALSQMGPELYNLFIKGYTEKQWGRPATELPSSIIQRLPFRLTEDDRYFSDAFQGIPVGGYTSIFERLLDGVEVRTGIDYFADRDYFNNLGKRLLYTGPIDQFFDYKFGRLGYRSLKFETELHESESYQDVAVVNYTSIKISYTRIIEHKHFEFGRQPVTWITREYPSPSGRDQEPFYPIKDQTNRSVFGEYKQWSHQLKRIFFGGRLAEYQYYDMHQVIGSALQRSDEIAESLVKE